MSSSRARTEPNRPPGTTTPGSRTAGVNGYLRATEYSTVTTAFTTFSTVLVS